MIEHTMEEILPLLARQVNRYTSGDSSSVTNETAKDILASIYYCMDAYEKAGTENQLQEIICQREAPEMVFEKGLIIEKRKFQKAKGLMETIQKETMAIENQAMQDTIYYGIPLFFQKYDICFHACNDAGSIDYPLCHEIYNLCGIDFIWEYLKNLSLENKLINRFALKDINEILCGYSEEYESLLINVFQLVLQNVLGLTILNQNYQRLSIFPDERAYLQKYLEKLKQKELENLLCHGAEKICSEFGLDETSVFYYKKAAVNFSFQLNKNLSFQKIQSDFITGKLLKTEQQTEFEEGGKMEDSQLRKLIDEMKICRLTSDKTEMVKRYIHSLSDLKEILGECFWGEEFKEVLSLLSKEEISFLKKEIELELEFLFGKVEELEPWKQELLKIESNFIQNSSTL
ncbi:DUF6179 domain-containing protein [Anaeromicropila populeti]|uniref:Uncharacterized protein n=1 Tax=Anaeromicropila populeti TaxID=37658 RepID=A0A1I6JCW7_9FIRM|nr:DUF6179 domain-containing protein [Anaeromicropila populeti]SFR76801.1 hypothetical protein SAMN05661086_01574 [Anaeromicropila populeti]